MKAALKWLASICAPGLARHQCAVINANSAPASLERPRDTIKAALRTPVHLVWTGFTSAIQCILCRPERRHISFSAQPVEKTDELTNEPHRDLAPIADLCACRSCLRTRRGAMALCHQWGALSRFY